MLARPLTHPIFFFSLSVYNAQKPLVSEFIRSSLVYFTMEIFWGEVGKVEWIAFNIGNRDRLFGKYGHLRPYSKTDNSG